MIRTVQVVDTTAPVISLNGGDVNISVRTVYNDTGAVANDNMDGDISNRIVVNGENIDTSVIGRYRITYDVNDSAGNSASQVIRTVNVINHAPVAEGARYPMKEDTNLTIVLNGSDANNGSILQYTIVEQPSNGSITLNNDTVVYTPNADYYGVDGFTFKVSDEYNASSNIASVDINISDVPEPNNQPIAKDINVSIDSNTTILTFNLDASDTDGNSLVYSIVTNPAFGTLTVDDNSTGQVSYNRGSYTGNTTFTYKANDGTDDSNIATVYIKSNIPNTPPIAYDKRVNLDTSGAPNIELDASDVDSTDVLSYRIDIPPSYGTVNITGNVVTYTPTANFTGTDSFTFVVNDGTDDSNIGYIFLRVGTRNLNTHILGWCSGNDTELWGTDGTTYNTQQIKNINSIGSSNPRNIMDINRTYFFIANDGIHGMELWKSEGTAGSTVLVKDIKPGSKGSLPHNLVDVNGTLFFAAADGKNGIELWKSDGTTLGTQMVKNINPRGHANPEELTNVNGVLYFSANNGKDGIELWRSSGTSGGTNQVNDINHRGSSRPFFLTNVNGVLYFSADDEGTFGVGRELWYYNTNVSDIASGYTNRGFLDITRGISSSNPENLYNYNGRLVFSADNRVFGRELWTNRGLDDAYMVENFAGTAPFEASNALPKGFKTVGNTLYFDAIEVLNGYNLRYLDTIGSGIKNVLYTDAKGNQFLTGEPFNLTQLNNQLFFNTKEMTTDQNGNVIEERINIWHVREKQAYFDAQIPNSKSLRTYEAIGDQLLFSTTKTDTSEELWISNIGSVPTKLLDGCGL